MGTGKAYSLHEIDDTRDNDREEKFEQILKRVVAAGGEINLDETTPLYQEIGVQEIETGQERIVEFNLAKFDFRLIRRTETKRLSGTGHHKSLEDLSRPRISIIMKRRPETSSDWQLVDLDEMF